MPGLTAHFITILDAAGWSADTMAWMHDWAYSVGAEPYSYASTAKLCVWKRGDDTWYIHRDLTQRASLDLFAPFEPDTLIEAWTDGSGTSDDEAVGSAAIFRVNGLASFTSPFKHSTWAKDGKVSSQVAELIGFQLALANCPRADLRLHILSDSTYTLGITNASKGWRAQSNLELINEIRSHLAFRAATSEHVKGHSGLELNDLADSLAKSMRHPFRLAGPNLSLHEPPSIPEIQERGTMSK